MKKVLLVAVIEALQQLPHEGLYVVLVEMDQTGLQKTHQVVVHVLEHEVKSTWEENEASVSTETANSQ